jgi:hypothetical protein
VAKLPDRQSVAGTGDKRKPARIAEFNIRLLSQTAEVSEPGSFLLKQKGTSDQEFSFA